MCRALAAYRQEQAGIPGMGVRRKETMGSPGSPVDHTFVYQAACPLNILQEGRSQQGPGSFLRPTAPMPTKHPGLVPSSSEI